MALARRIGIASVVLSLAGAASAQVQSPAPALVKVTWQQALDRALARNPSIIVANQEIERASALVREARAGWMPLLTGNGSYVRLDSPRMSSGVTTVPIQTWNGNLQ